MTTRGTGSLFVVTFLILLCSGTAAAQGTSMVMSSGTPSGTGQARTYYIAADEVTWDYAPGSMNQITGQPFGKPESPWVASGPHRIGKVCKKGSVPRVHGRHLHSAEATAERLGAPGVLGASFAG
jgi:hypothetical protein